mgnify:CR=1 FL=1
MRLCWTRPSCRINYQGNGDRQTTKEKELTIPSVQVVDGVIRNSIIHRCPTHLGMWVKSSWSQVTFVRVFVMCNSFHLREFTKVQDPHFIITNKLTYIIIYMRKKHILTSSKNKFGP